MSSTSDQYEIVAYIKDNPVMVLGTIGANGLPHGAAVYGVATTSSQLYFVTKTETQKFRNLNLNPNVSVTIVNSAENSSLQAEGKAEIINNPRVVEMVMAKMTSVHARSAEWMPPIAKLHAGGYQIVGIQLHHARLARFRGERIGSESIFKEDS